MTVYPNWINMEHGEELLHRDYDSKMNNGEGSTNAADEGKEQEGVANLSSSCGGYIQDSSLGVLNYASHDEESSSADEQHDFGENESRTSSKEEGESGEEENEEEENNDVDESLAQVEDTTEAQTASVSDSAEYEKTLIVLDWDDTIMPTAYLQDTYGNRLGGVQLSERDAKEIRALEEVAIEIFILSLTLGNVRIITNADEGWVEATARKFMPDLYEVLTELGIEIISAKSKYEERFERNLWACKIEAFAQEVRSLHSNRLRVTANSRFISIGDSEHEHEAARELVDYMPESCIKIVKLNENRSVAGIRDQIDHLCSRLELIIESQEHIEIFIQNLL